MAAFTHTLAYPLQLDQETIKEIHLRRPTVKDLRLLDERSGIDSSIGMVASLSGLTEATIEMLDGADFMQLSEAVEGFLPDSQETGKA